MNKLNNVSVLSMKFDSYCRKVVKNHGCTMIRNEKRQQDRTIDCIAFDEKILNTLYIEDQYNIFASKINLPHISVLIDDDDLYSTLKRLPRKRLEILLLSYFMDMSDNEIGKVMKLAKSTVQHNRVKALGFLKDSMKGENKK